MRPCIIASCNRSSAAFSPLCPYHRKRKGRHGHPLQTAVTAKDLAPHAKAIRRWLRTRSSVNTKELLTNLWDKLIQDARIFLEQVNAGRPHQRNVRQAYEIILRVSNERKPMDAIEVLLAMGHLFQCQRRRFQDELAFGYQVARRFRALAECSFGRRWDNARQRVRIVYRDVPPRTLQALWNVLLESRLPLYGMKIAEKDLAERSRWVARHEVVLAAVLGTSSVDAEGDTG